MLALISGYSEFGIQVSEEAVHSFRICINIPVKIRLVVFKSTDRIRIRKLFRIVGIVTSIYLYLGSMNICSVGR